MTQHKSVQANENVSFSGALGIHGGDVVSIIGCGGKTSLMLRLARELRQGRVMISTTTRIQKPPADLVDHTIGLSGTMRPGINLLHGGEPADAKLHGVPPEAYAKLASADAVLLIEADGSRMLPLKGWAEYEPVVPPSTTITIGVCTLWPVGQHMSDANTHRPALFTALTGAQPGEEITVQTIAAMLTAPGGMFAKAHGRLALYISQVETAAERELAGQLVAALPQSFLQRVSRIVCGSIPENRCEVLHQIEG